MPDLSGESNTSNLTGPEPGLRNVFLLRLAGPRGCDEGAWEVICSLRNVKTAWTSCRGLPGHAQLLPWVRVTFFKTRNDIYRTGGL